MFDMVFGIVFGAVAVFIIFWFIRYAISVFRGNYRHTSGSKRVWWIPGGGTHGTGQVPPIVVDEPDEDD